MWFADEAISGLAQPILHQTLHGSDVLVHQPMFGFISGLGYTEMVLFGVIALMLFGSRLPEVARNFGHTYRQLRGKVDEFQREFRDWDREASDTKPKSYLPQDADDEKRPEPLTPKFTPPPEDDDDQ